MTLTGRTVLKTAGLATFVYDQHLVAEEKKFFEEEGVAGPSPR